MRKLISFDDETYQALVQLSRDRMGTLQELADEAFRDLLKKHGVPRDLKDALRRSAARPSSGPANGKAAAGRSRQVKAPPKSGSLSKRRRKGA